MTRAFCEEMRKFGALVLALAVLSAPAVAQAGTRLLLAPWTGPRLPTSDPEAVQYKLTVSGVPGEKVQLQAGSLAQGWIASFCTSEVCSPYKVTLKLPPSGTTSIEFQAIRDDDAAPRKTHVVITTDDGAKAVLDVRSAWTHRP